MSIISHIKTGIFLLLFVVASKNIYAQSVGSKINDRNALDYRFQKIDRTLPRFDKGYPFRSRIYTVFSAGVEASWEGSSNLGKVANSVTTRAGLGYLFTPIHGIETAFVYGQTSMDGLSGTKSNYFGADLNYVMNLTNFGYRANRINRFEALVSAGVSYRYSTHDQFGFNAGIRLQYNPARNVGIFLEPRLTTLVSRQDEYKFATLPSISAGLIFRFNSPEYYIWNYITPIAIKTNLLYDLATAINIELEIPIRNRWSITMEWLFPWWEIDSKKLCFQVLSATLEGRYWFGRRNGKEQLTGWFMGTYIGGGLYDTMFNEEKGRQGEFYTIGAGVGYAHKIARNLSMEYYVGGGYISKHYRKYYWDGFDYTLNEPSPTSFIMPGFMPRAKVSLVWWLKLRSKRGGK